MSQYTVMAAETVRPYTVRRGPDTGKQGNMQVITMTDAGGTKYDTTLFGKDEAFVGDSIEAQIGEYNEKYKNYAFTVKSIKHVENPVPNQAPALKHKIDAPQDDDISRRTCRQNALNAVSRMFMGKGDEDDTGKYLAIAEMLSEWSMTGTTEPRIGKEEKIEILKKFDNNVGAAREACARVTGKPFLSMLTNAEAERLMTEDPKF